MRIHFVFFFFVSLFSISGCVFFPSPSVDWVDVSVSEVWPPPPDTARIRYLRSLYGAVDFTDKGRTGRFFRWLTGENDVSFPLISPYGVAADGKGRVWVADMGIPAIHVIDLLHRRVDYIFQAGDKFLVSPVGVALDLSRDRLYVSDSVLNSVFVYDHQGRYVSELSAPSTFGRPGGLTVDAAGRLYVTDVVKAAVEIFSPEGVYLRSLKSASPPDFQFNLPSNVAVAEDGTVFVIDSMNFRIEVFDVAGRSQRIIGQLGDVPGSFARPRGIAIDGAGHVYVADAVFDNIQIFNTYGDLLMFFGQKGSAEGQFSLPSGLFVDQFDRLYVADVYNHRIQVFQPLPVAD